MKTSAKTKHRYLYEGVKWGQLDAKTTPYIDHRIFENRDKFAEIFGISCAATLRRPWTETDSFRHVEMYWDAKNEIVLICSLHGNHRPPERLNMREILPLYSQEARTYMRHFATVRELEKATARINGGLFAKAWRAVRGLFESGHELNLGRVAS